MDTWTFGLKHLARGFEIGIDTRSHYLHRLNRPNRESYWSREERAGTNDVNAISALRSEVDNLPEDLRKLVLALAPRDRFFALTLLGAFRSDSAHFHDIRRLERMERGALSGVRRSVMVAARLRAQLAR
jgi:hypothetical protein